jgi:hypothetical protein
LDYLTTGRVQRANLDGSNVELLLETPSSTADITLDLQGGKMYWVINDLSDSEIERANLDGSNPEILVSNYPTPVMERSWGITLDLQQGKMYWTDFNAEKIQRADLDGSNLEDVIASGIFSPQHIDISSSSTAIEDVVTTIPSDYALAQNFPNPFNPTTTIPFEIPGTNGTKQRVSLIIYDLRGRHVKTLIDSELEPGSHRVMWDGRNDRGEAVSSGIYLYSLRSAGQSYTKKMIVIQ